MCWLRTIARELCDLGGCVWIRGQRHILGESGHVIIGQILTSRYCSLDPGTAAVLCCCREVAGTSADTGRQRDVWFELRWGVESDSSVRAHVLALSRLQYQHICAGGPLTPTAFGSMAYPGVVHARVVDTVL